MNIYSKKQRWKLVMMVVATAIVGVSLWYTGQVVKKLKQEEIKKVQQWASDVKYNIVQLNIANASYQQQRDLYEALKAREKREVERLAQAMRELNKDLLDYTFIMNIIQENTTIPVILTDDKNRVSSIKNTDFDRDDFRNRILSADSTIADKDLQKQAEVLYQDTLKILIDAWSQKYDPVEIVVFGTTRNRIYFRESNGLLEFDKNIETLQRNSDSLFQDFNQRLAAGNPLVPMIFMDDSTGQVIATNISEEYASKPAKLKQIIADMRSENDSIPVYFGNDLKGYIFYRNSALLRELSIYPYIQFGIIGLFLLVAYFMFNSFRNAEQNQVWVGMAKETAHQLGTPISSLMAWTELLRDYGIPEDMIVEMNKDLERLQTVSDRFGKIGSAGTLHPADMHQVVEQVLSYVQKRVSAQVKISVSKSGDTVVPMNVSLMSWVIENLAKNAVDAMEGNGELKVHLSREGKKLMVDFTDTGKGIPSRHHKTVFTPGFTTKPRGWGLGLALVKRIVGEYHHGKIFVKESEPGKGATFRLILRS